LFISGDVGAIHSKVVDVSIGLPPVSSVLIMTRNKSVHICNRSHARRVNSSKITMSYGIPLFDAFVRKESRHLAAWLSVTKLYRL